MFHIQVWPTEQAMIDGKRPAIDRLYNSTRFVVHLRDELTASGYHVVVDYKGTVCN